MFFFKLNWELLMMFLNFKGIKAWNNGYFKLIGWLQSLFWTITLYEYLSSSNNRNLFLFQEIKQERQETRPFYDIELDVFHFPFPCKGSCNKSKEIRPVRAIKDWSPCRNPKICMLTSFVCQYVLTCKIWRIKRWSILSMRCWNVDGSYIGEELLTLLFVHCSKHVWNHV